MTKRKNANGLSACALFAALIAVFAQISIPLPGVPVNMALLAVYLGAMLLGPRLSSWACVVYLLMGLCGVPVFSGFGAGPAALFGPTGGFLLGYPLCALITGRLCAMAQGRPPRRFLACLAGMLACGALGIAWFTLQTGHSSLCWWLIYLPGDLLKIVFAVLLSNRLSGPFRRFRL